MKFRTPKVPARWIWVTIAVVGAVAGIASWSRWFPATSNWVNQTIVGFRSGGEAADSHAGEGEQDSHAGHDHAAHVGHDEATSLELSQQALRNVGLTPNQIQPIRLETFRKAITVPAVVVERPGRTRVQVATPMTGVITHVHAVQGEAIEPGTLLFKIRLTHEELVQAQTEFVKALGELDVEEREISRLTEISNSGAIAGKVLLERQYARDKLTALMRAQREALRLHGLSEQQVDQISETRRLLRELQITAPSIDTHDEDDEELKLSRIPTRPVAYTRYADTKANSESSHGSPLILQQLDVHKGQSVMAGETLCILADYDELFIEGLAFEQDVLQLRQASEKSWKVDAIFDQPGSGSRVVEGLEIAYLANQIDSNSRTLHFYVRLPNEVAKDRRADGDRFVEWRYLPGQRLQLRVPVEEWPDQIVLPVDAVAREGAEYFIFQQNGGHFDRVPVHVKYKDQRSAVIENDGSLFPGDVVAMRGAHQMQMALKNKAGGGVDPHAGHNH
jgi:biotin carboxyl carrier protein